MAAPSAQSAELLKNGIKSAGQESDAITKIEHFRVKPRWLFVRVETRKGVSFLLSAVFAAEM